MVSAALLEVHAATLERRWLDEARRLAADMVRLFRDEAGGGFHDTGSDHERLVVRPRNLFDNAVPCGSSVAVESLLRLAVLTGEADWQTIAMAALRPMGDLMARHPTAFGRWLCGLDFSLGPVVEVAVVAPRGGDAGALLAEVFSRYLPNRVVAGSLGGDAVPGPLLAGRTSVAGRATAYVCRNYACDLPVTSPADLGRQLDQV